MCPSYMVTLEEQHSTRGRAHMLFELLQGEVVREGWQDEHVKQALDLCLSCKACKSECPANVDMATYRAEFLSHYYEGRSRPLHAYAFGMIDRWLRLAAVAPAVANALLARARCRHLDQTAPAHGARAAASSARAAPRFGGGRAATASALWEPEATGAAATDRLATADVILWVDTFNNYFHPETSQAALDVLQAAGYSTSPFPRGSCVADARSTTSVCSIARSTICDRSWTS